MLSFFTGIVAGMIGSLIIFTLVEEIDPYPGLDDWEDD